MSGQTQIPGHQYSPRLPPFHFGTICIQIVFPVKAAGCGARGFALTFVFNPGPNAQMFTAWPQDQAHVDVGTNDSNTLVDTCTFPEMLVSTSTELHICVHTPAACTEP